MDDIEFVFRSARIHLVPRLGVLKHISEWRRAVTVHWACTQGARPICAGVMWAQPGDPRPYRPTQFPACASRVPKVRQRRLLVLARSGTSSRASQYPPREDATFDSRAADCLLARNCGSSSRRPPAGTLTQLAEGEFEVVHGVKGTLGAGSFL